MHLNVLLELASICARLQGDLLSIRPELVQVLSTITNHNGRHCDCGVMYCAFLRIFGRIQREKPGVSEDWTNRESNKTSGARSIGVGHRETMRKELAFQLMPESLQRAHVISVGKPRVWPYQGRS
jgi:hypothetical protein